uniref:Uncharacterized protein n=1 Tax=Podarcis muralis TaxID=64176 RepID=A0A670JBJ2_PODMU
MACYLSNISGHSKTGGLRIITYIKAPFFPVLPVWPGFCERPLSLPAVHCPDHPSPQSPAPTTSWSAFPPAASSPCLSFSLQIRPPPPPTAQRPP